MPIEGVVLQMKSMHIDAVVNFPFPTPPDQFALKKAETVLTHLGALSVSPMIHKGSFEVLTTGTIGGHITDLGKAMSLFPLSPRFSRMLVGGRQHGCLPYVISIVSVLSVGDPFLREEGINAEGDESDNDCNSELSHLHSDAVRAKEARKIQRRAFFQSQQVLLIVVAAAPGVSLHYAFRPMGPSATHPVIYSSYYQSSARTSMLEADINSVLNISSDQK
jgi:ATP-dependent RNA helicase DHX37/DHR1